MLTGLAQLTVFLAWSWVGAEGLTWGFNWLSGATGGAATVQRSAVLTAVASLALTILPILAKWLLVGRWRSTEIRLWSVGYLRFWLVKVLVQTNPVVFFVGTPLFVLYLRALGAKIGSGVTIHSAVIPVATDLITVGEGTVIRRGCSYSGYRAMQGVIQTGAVTLGCGVYVGEKTVLDIDTSMGDGAELGHSSTLRRGQSVPAGQTWHGSPAEPARTTYRSCPPVHRKRIREVGYCALLVAVVQVGGTVLASIGASAITDIPALNALLQPGSVTVTTSSFYLTIGWLTAGLFGGGITLGVAYVTMVPRMLHHLFITPGRVYPLYGFHYIVQSAIDAATNVQFFMDLFGDSSAVVHYLRAIGYRMGRIVQTGSNFGAELRQDNPFLITIGSNTMVSDALSIMNVEYSGSSFMVNPVTIGANNFLGNYLAWPSQARIGDNVLLATKAMVPIDGPVRANVGLLGSPPFEIPRSVSRDGGTGHLDDAATRYRLLKAKNRHNAVTALLFLLLRYVQLLGTTTFAAVALHFFRDYGPWTIMADLVVSTLFLLATAVLAERMAYGFHRLGPRFCSIYDHYFWTHERLWKLLATPIFNGTPFKSVLWRALGVRIGRRVFDDGCSIPEKTLVSIGDDAVLNAGTIIQCHSLEDGAFKSGYTSLGAGVTLGVHAFVHYGVHMAADSVLDANSFLMKGEYVGEHQSWGGNPAAEFRIGRRGYRSSSNVGDCVRRPDQS